MKKARIIILKSEVDALLKNLHEAGVVDIRKTQYEGLEEGRPLSSFDEISAILLELRTIRTLMERYVPNSDEEPELLEGPEAMRRAKELAIGAKLTELSRTASKISERLEALKSEESVVKSLMDYRGVDFSKLNTETLSFKVGELQSVKLPRLQQKMNDAKTHCRLISEPHTSMTLVLYEEKDVSIVDGLLSEAGFTEVDLPESLTTPRHTLARVQEETNALNSELDSLKKEMLDISRSNHGNVIRLINSLEVEAERAEVAERFASSKTLFILEGWLLETEFKNLEELISRYSGKAMLQDVKYGHDEMPPTVLDNPKVASPFEFLTSSYSLPNYFEFDPTLPYFIGLPIIYGMIVGDFIYGLISIFLGLLLMQKFRKSYIMYNVSKIWMYSGFTTLVFGIIFDEWGGFSHVGLLNYLGSWAGITVLTEPLYAGFHRMAHILELIGLTILVGMIHLGFGFAIGAINEWKHNNKKHAYAKIAWIGVEIGLLLTMLPLMGLVAVPALMYAGIAILLVSVIVLAITEGILGIIELPGLLGNILSYTRIAAIGIVGIVIAEILLNQFLIPLPEHGIFALILLPLFLVLHVVNAFIAMFESLVQGGRLNIVEFRSKFLHGGGEVFVPFSVKKNIEVK
jgi:V/A-type H+-transporting ATPase subunit I